MTTTNKVRLQVLEKELARQAAEITKLREEILFLKSAPAVRWWSNQTPELRDAVARDAVEAAGK